MLALSRDHRHHRNQQRQAGEHKCRVALELNLGLTLHEHLLRLAAGFLAPFHFVSTLCTACTVVFFRVFGLTALFVHMLWELRVRSCGSAQPQTHQPQIMSVVAHQLGSYERKWLVSVSDQETCLADMALQVTRVSEG
jgi:hypothetical protein